MTMVSGFKGEKTDLGKEMGGRGLKKGPWTPEEDKRLREYVNQHGQGNWNIVQKETGLQRCGKSCRLRWANHLRPDLKKGALTMDEQRKIYQLHRAYGNKWAKMASELPGRTDNEIKNFWNTKAKKDARSKFLPSPTKVFPEAFAHGQIRASVPQEFLDPKHCIDPRLFTTKHLKACENVHPNNINTVFPPQTFPDSSNNVSTSAIFPVAKPELPSFQYQSTGGYPLLSTALAPSSLLPVNPFAQSWMPFPNCCSNFYDNGSVHLATSTLEDGNHESFRKTLSPDKSLNNLSPLIPHQMVPDSYDGLKASLSPRVCNNQDLSIEEEGNIQMPDLDYDYRLFDDLTYGDA